MSLAFEPKRERSKIEEEVMRLKEEIERTGKVKIGDEVFHVKKVTVFEGSGVVSGWNIHVIGDKGGFVFDMTDREDITFMRIRMRKPGYVIAVGEDFDENRAVIVYRKE